MSCDEGMRGYGVYKQAEVRKLRRELMELYNAELKRMPLALQKRLRPANSRTKVFPILGHDGTEGGIWDGYDTPSRPPTQCWENGVIVVDPSTGGFRFEVYENNHIMEEVNRNKLFRHLMKFIGSIPLKGTRYGAKTVYWNEYDGHESEIKYYGGWANDRRRRSE